MTPIRKVRTGIRGLDQILGGGLPEGRTTLVSGGPGSGKTVLGLEFVYRGALAGEPGLFVSFEERADMVRQNALSLGWKLEPLEAARALTILEPRIPPEAIVAGEFNLRGFLAILAGLARDLGVRRLAIDAVDVLTRVIDEPRRERSELFALHEWLRDRSLTTLLTVKADETGASPVRPGFLEFAADCVLRLDQRVTEQVSTRRLRVVKYRGSGFGRNEHPYVIDAGGTRIIAVSSQALEQRPLGEAVSMGQPDFDRVLGGGLRRGACALIAGASGTGKTTLAATFARSACDRGEKVLYVNFEESEPAMLENLLSPGIDLSPAVRAGMLTVLTSMPESAGAEEHLVRALDAIEAFAPEHLVLEAVSACPRFGTPQAAFDYVMRLVSACKQRGITTVLTNQTPGLHQSGDISGIGFSSLVDTAILLRHHEHESAFVRSVLVLKSRGMRHSLRSHRYLITDTGIVIDEPGGAGRPES